MRPFAAVTLIAFALSGCGKVPVATQWKLRSFRIETADLSSLRVAARGPDWVVPTPNAASIILTHWREGDENAKKVVTVRLRLARRGEDEALLQMAGPQALGVYEIDPRDLPVAVAAQEDAKRMKKEDPTPRHGEITIDRAACRNGGIPAGPIPIDLYVHVDDETGWLPFFQGYDLRPEPPEDTEFLQKFVEHVPPCGKSSNRVGQAAASR